MRGKKTSETGQSILRGVKQALAWAAGDEKAARVVHVPAAVDVKAIRTSLGLSQSDFADRYGFSLRTLQEWEQGRTQPDRAVRAYLTVIERRPKVVQEALTGKMRTLSLQAGAVRPAGPAQGVRPDPEPGERRTVAGRQRA
jgi:putative transcriptional regulator